MMSMDNGILPQAYQDQFAMAQYNAPPLSYPLVLKTFQQYFGQKPTDVFDEFSRNAVHAASIGQVHKARKGDQQLAVKIQYPGVAESISSDLKLVKPLASQLLNMKASDMKQYMDEVESKLLEETDYKQELRSGNEIGEACAFISGLRFPVYYEKWSNNRILTMDWIDGLMFPEFLKTDPSQEVRNAVGQAMWDFFLYQMKVLRKVHADPHPGNFIIDAENNLCVIDFGCVKEIPNDFFVNYFQLLKPEIIRDQAQLDEIYVQIELFKPEDTPEQKKLLQQIYGDMIGLLGLPFHSETFDFADEAYFKRIFVMGEELSQNKDLRKMNNARGSKHAIYIMRTFFGLYSLMHQLKANVKLNYSLD
jgi:predicted unusual protein kinase regulating ubiquinone biosynthesis (AarF/ABC1/UbiB family)